VVSVQPLERAPIKWNHLIDKDSLKIEELEHVGIEQVEQLFRSSRYAVAQQGDAFDVVA
jgi:hypothetical protein